MKLKDLCTAVVVLAAAAFIVQALMGAMVSAEDDSMVLSKLDKILKSQDSISKDLAAIKSELNIVKIRVTQAQ